MLKNIRFKGGEKGDLMLSRQKAYEVLEFVDEHLDRLPRSNATHIGEPGIGSPASGLCRELAGSCRARGRGADVICGNEKGEHIVFALRVGPLG